jgi:hypothetical protein
MSRVDVLKKTKADPKVKQAFLDALGELPAHDQEKVLLKASEKARHAREMEQRAQEPCPCESGELFGACHGNVP